MKNNKNIQLCVVDVVPRLEIDDNKDVIILVNNVIVTRIKPTRMITLGDEKNHPRGKMLFLYISNFKKQGLPKPYMQLTISKNGRIDDNNYSKEEAERIFRFFGLAIPK